LIVIVDYGMGNLRSIQNMLKAVDTDSTISSNIEDIQKASKLILPGVGAFDSAVRNIEKLGLSEILSDKVLNNKIPILGICLGLQLLTKRSEEGALKGLGFIEGETVHFNINDKQNRLKIPHMGWNTVRIMKDSRLFDKMYDEPKFYFVHSYHVHCCNDEDILCSTQHGCEFTSAVEKDNVFGVQFHPEKSHKFGMKLLKNFAELT